MNIILSIIIEYKNIINNIIIYNNINFNKNKNK